MKRTPMRRKTGLKQKTPLKSRRKKPRRTAREIDEAYLDFVRMQPCAVPSCEAKPVHPHHLKSRGAGGSDYTCIPLCWLHHTEVHTISLTSFESRYSIEMVKINAHLLSRYHEIIGKSD
jgi:hypothetical protein